MEAVNTEKGERLWNIPFKFSSSTPKEVAWAGNWCLPSGRPCLTAVTAVGTNSAATSAMLKAGPHRAATGENAVVVACRTADIIVGPLGIVIADAMLGEVTPAMAAAVGQSRAKRVLIPFSHCDNIVAGVPELATGALIQCAVRSVTALAGELADGPLESSEGRA